ncbi:hemerythrin domain-containing protein [Ferrigenium sp. UT4]
MAMNEDSADFGHPLQYLHVCHGKIMQQCAALRDLSAYMQQHGGDPHAQQAAQNILGYFETTGALHHQDEEQALFPALQSALTAETAEPMESLMARVLAEHAELDALWSQLQPCLQCLAQAQPADLPAALTEKFIEGYFAHIALEEQELLPLSEYLLKPEQLASLGARMAAQRNVTI